MHGNVAERQVARELLGEPTAVRRRVTFFTRRLTAAGSPGRS